MSEKTLTEKLMIKAGRKILLVNPPEGYEALLGSLPEGVTILTEATEPVDIIQVFVHSRKELEEQLGRLKPMLTPQGILWVTYHKGTSRKKTDINRDSIREYAESIGMKAVAMIAVDSDWSALRLKVVK